MTTEEDARQENIRVGAAVRAAAEAMTEPGWVTVDPVPLTKRRVVLDMVPIARYPHSGGSAMYARPTDDGEEGALGLPIIYLTPEDFRALGEREQITITIEPGNLLNDEAAEEVTCPNCGRDHIPDEGEDHDTCVECQDGRGGDES